MPASDSRRIVVEWVQLSAGPHLLEGELAYPEDSPDTRVNDAPCSAAGGIVLAGSHPLLGGTMHNNVVRALGDGLAERGWITLRFNYRGVGRSEGPRLDVAEHMAEFWETSHVPHEMDLWRDVQAAADFLSPVASGPLVLVGYSFGCALLPSLELPEPPAALVLIAPPVGKHDYDDFTRVSSPLLVVLSDDDFAVERPRLQDWVERLPTGAKVIQESRDNHFFRGHEAWLVDTVSGFLEDLPR